MIKNGTVASIAFGGEGIVRHNGLVIFVPFTVPGDCIDIQLHAKKKNFAHGRALQIHKMSPSRIEPLCSHFGHCGGCQFQHMRYPSQVDVKRSFIIDALQRIGKIAIKDLPIISAEKQWYYRQHIRLTLRRNKKGFAAGYLGCDPTKWVPISHCLLFAGEKLFSSLEHFLSILSHEGIESGSLRLIKTRSDHYIFAFNFPKIPSNFHQAAAFIERNPSWKGMIVQSPAEDKLTFGDVACEVECLGLQVQFSPFGFVQNHPEQSELLYQAILDCLPSESQNILDLYCGIGITSLLFAREKKKVWAIESHPETLALAKKNATLNNLSPQFFEEKAETLGPILLKKEHPDTVFCNPPRTGIHPALLQALIAQKSPNILYVSCMPSTLARDLKQLTESGYHIDLIQGFDLFPQTTHVETLVRLKSSH